MTNTEQMVMNLGWIDCGHLDGQQIYLSPEEDEEYMSEENIDWLNQSISMLLLEYSHKPNKFNFKLSSIKPNHGKHRLETTLEVEEFDDLPF
tara:strand:+ start:167 stop:442 length:276 start_codon:yes stop_codon:yes gene_type:complete